MNETIIGKKYEVKMLQGSEITGKLTKVMNDTLVFNINNNDIKLPKNRIEKISQVKLKKTALIIGTIVTIGGIIVISKSLPENEDQISVL